MILILGLLTTIGPFSIDMYLPAFPRLAADLGADVAQASFSISSYFVGLALGQLFYGPLLDRFGRKRPLASGLALYALASLGCFASASLPTFVAWRFAQALGGCVATVSAFAWVRDLFPPRESARVLSLLVLVLGISPLVAPSFGGVVADTFGWRAIFLILPVIALLILSAALIWLPAGRAPDAGVRLGPRALGRRYVDIYRDPGFTTHAWAGALSFAGLFAYLAASPALFMTTFAVKASTYGWLFALLAIGPVGASQVNLILLKRYRDDEILRGALSIQALVGLFFLILALTGTLSFSVSFALLFVYLGCAGSASPNATALTLAPFAGRAGTASALNGTLQMAVGALATVAVGALDLDPRVALGIVMLAAGSGAWLTLARGARHTGLARG